MAATRSVERFFEFSLLGLVASGFFALAGARYLDRPTLVLTFLALLLRALIIAGWVKLEISPRAISAAALLYLGFYPLDFYLLSHDFFTATLHGVCFLAGVKILTARTNRDYLYTGAVAFIELIGAALLSFQATFFGWLALYILFAIAAFTSAEIRRGVERGRQVVYPPNARTGWRLATVAVAATAGILVLTTALFLTVPRTARAAAMLFPGAPHLTGYSNVVDLGVFGQIGKDTRPVMHVLSYSRALPQHLKWRGTALSRFDGKRWSEPPLAGVDVPVTHGTAEVAGPLQRSRRDGRRLLYRVDVTSSDTGTLFIAGIPEYVNITAARLVRTPEESFRVLPVTGEQLQYEVSAHSGPPLPGELAAGARTRYLQLPPIDSRIWSLARSWSGSGEPMLRAGRIEQHLRRDFSYVLDSGDKPVADPLANFLFVTKRGYCEYFASAMAVMLRSIGIPSRVVTGFQSGFFNDVSGMYVVRASDAHAWVEGWIEGRGWVTFDPTPLGVAPAPGLLSRLNMYLDAADSLWQQWVVAYDLGHQAALAARFANGLHGWTLSRAALPHDVAPAMLAAAKKWGLPTIAAMLLIFFFPRAARAARSRAKVRRIAQGGGSAGDESILYGEMLRVLARRGYEKPAWFTPLEFASHLPAEEKQRVTRFTDLYNGVRFGGEAQATAEMAKMLSEFER